mmetsp:Transcript_18526/g.27098  ORF Transcript_18526/g.27098 Transcript_18526/m.27098 type:complete len:425 (+) Transcript_18526:315-1589(+)|eukprot:CAMPEP_0195519652 /NCGR_PEP_ID=MMETSP0794_2-20130614/15213_1 /TAXON_ID=515487 /ORGANISM="Stephanopyxis turris, Strain CCMP 815" /LENGTH=424 /DNA_ID=CAMNT_0040648843 /DNA_START=315 /DNA_END=1589 /DNA_ORIENTATION=+
MISTSIPSVMDPYDEYGATTTFRLNEKEEIHNCREDEKEKQPQEDEEEEREEEREEDSPFWGTRMTYSSFFVSKIRENIPSGAAAVKQTLDGIADAISKSATNLVAELSDMEREAREQQASNNYHDYHNNGNGDNHNQGDGDDDERRRKMMERAEEERQSLQEFVTCCNIAFAKLPWEVWRENSKNAQAAVKHAKETAVKHVKDAANASNSRGKLVEDETLKQKMLALSLDDATFTTGPSSMSKEERFMEEHAGTIRRLLKIDGNLSRAHEKLSGIIVKESIFWRNYFHHCERIRIMNSVTRKQNQDKICDKNRPAEKKEVVVESTQLSPKNETKPESQLVPSSSFTSPTSVSVISSSSVGDDESMEKESDIVHINKTGSLFSDYNDLPLEPKYSLPHTLSNGSLVLIGADDDDDLDNLIRNDY